MPNRADVQMVNQSLNNLGDSLLRERMFKQQQQDTEANRAERTREFDANQQQEERRTRSLEKSADTMAKYREGVLKNQQVQQGINQIRTRVTDIAARHKAGQISTGEANRQARLLEDQLRQSPELLIRESGLADVEFQDIADKPKGEFNTAPIANSKHLADLRAALVDAQAGGDQGKVAKAQQALDDFQAMTRQKQDDDSETVTEEPMFDLEGKPVIDPATGQQRIRRRVTSKRKPGVPSAPAAATGDASASFESEAAARSAGKKTGDVVTLKGVGKVRLK